MDQGGYKVPLLKLQSCLRRLAGTGEGRKMKVFGWWMGGLAVDEVKSVVACWGRRPILASQCRQPQPTWAAGTDEGGRWKIPASKLFRPNELFGRCCGNDGGRLCLSEVKESANCGDGDFLFQDFFVLSLLLKEVGWETQRSRRANYGNLGCWGEINHVGREPWMRRSWCSSNSLAS